MGAERERKRELLLERTPSKEGTHWFIFPFAGRLAHEGLSSIIAYRMSKLEPMTLSVSFNDYGLSLSTNSQIELNEAEWRKLLNPDGLVEELFECMNQSEMAKRQFREVARVAGLIFQGYPGAQKSIKQVQASGSLFFDVFAKRRNLQIYHQISRFCPISSSVFVFSLHHFSCFFWNSSCITTNNRYLHQHRFSYSQAKCLLISWQDY